MSYFIITFRTSLDENIKQLPGNLMPFVQILSIILKIKKIGQFLVTLCCWETGIFKPHKLYDINNNRKCAYLTKNEDPLFAAQANFEPLVHDWSNSFFFF